jgi:DnaJ like chaperone protein
MSNIGKIIGFFGGFLLARWEGAIAGVLLGSVVDNYLLSPSPNNRPNTGTYNPYGTAASYSFSSATDFNYILLSLSAAVMQSDGKTTVSELDYVKDFFIRQFGIDKTKESLLTLRELLKRSIQLENICAPVRQNMSYNGRVQLLHYLFGIAYADNSFSPQEERVLNRIAQLLGINMVDYRSVAAMFTPARNNAAYEILGVTETASDDDVKKAYRQMALKFHPDKVGHLGEDVLKAAEEKFKKIQGAYEDIKRARGFA